MINFTFPLLPVPKFVAQIVTENSQATVIFCAILLWLGFINLWRSAATEYKDPALARNGLVLLGIAAVLAIVGVFNAVMVVIGWYVLWRGIMYWLIWRMLIRNILILWNPPAKDP